MTRLAAIALTGLFLAGCASASFAQTAATTVAAAALPDSVPSDLPRTARPLHYRIEIVPNAAHLTFSGTSTIDVEVVERTDTLTLHANELDFSDARLVPAPDAGDGVALEVKVDRAAQTVRLRAPQPIAPGAYRLVLRYRGTINTQATGLFALDYPDKRTGETVRGLFTQFEAPDARRFAPLFDEPSYKATFDLSAIVPAGQMAVSNMPVAKQSTLPDGRSLVRFAPSPKMSTYLLFFGLGEFDRATAKVGPTEVGVVTQKGSAAQAAFALDSFFGLHHCW